MHPLSCLRCELEFQVPEKQQRSWSPELWSRSAAPLPAASSVGCQGIPSHLFPAGEKACEPSALRHIEHFPSGLHLSFPLPMLPFPLHLQGFLLCVCSFSRVPAPCQQQPHAKDSQERFAFWKHDREKPQLAIYPHHRLLCSLSGSPPGYSPWEPEDGMIPKLRGSLKK